MPPGCWGADRCGRRTCSGRGPGPRRCGSRAGSPGASESRQPPAASRQLRTDAGVSGAGAALPAAAACALRSAGWREALLAETAGAGGRGAGGGVEKITPRTWPGRAGCRAADGWPGSGAEWVVTAVGASLIHGTQPCVPHPYCGPAPVTAARKARWAGSANQGQK